MGEGPTPAGKNANLLSSNVLIICSGGRDNSLIGNCSASVYPVQPYISTDYDQDIIWADGYFLRWPGQIK